MANSLFDLIKQADNYTVAYCRQYKVTDEDTVKAIYVQHLAYLIGQAWR